jgi:hypothetical protein
MSRRKWAIAVLVVVGLLVVGVVATGAVFYFRFYKPLMSANTYVIGSQRLEHLITNQSPYDATADRVLTDDQVQRFVSVEERVEERIGRRMATFRTQYEVLNSRAGGPTSRVVRAAMGEIGGVYLQAKETQYRALNAAGFSKAEYEWVRERVYVSAGLPFAHLDLPQILVNPGDLEEVIDIERSSADAATNPSTRQRVEQLKKWLVLVFFDL